jgi:poly(hydroxyalkanoate) granule-associated protein
MTTEKKESVQDRTTIDVSNLPDEVSSRAREIWLAGLGALSRLEEEGDKVFRNLVDRGEDYEQKRREQIEDATSNLQKQQESLTEGVTKRIDDATKSVEKAVSDTFSGTLNRIGVPTRDEVQGLSKKVGDLSAKLDALSAMLDAQREDVETVVYHVTPHDDGWAVMREGNEKATSVHETKKEALSAAREIAKDHVPSQLIVHKQDRSVQDTYAYDEEDEA